MAASAVLLLTDRPRSGTVARSSDSDAGEPERVLSVALFQHVSQPIIEEGASGVIAGLAASGYQDGGSIRLKRFNAEGDAGTSNAIARELVGSQYDLIITLSTPSLQAVASANRDAKVPHVFGMVSDPVAAGVGIARDDPLKHAPYMVGLGTMQPVAEAFQMARKMSPGLKRVGVAWNPSEANSEACTKIARIVCKEVGIELLEANVENSAAVREAVAAVIGRGAEAVWIGGDVTVLSAVESVIGPARAAGIPVFSNLPGSAQRGALFDIGADYYQVGGKVGQLASRVLAGESPASMPILYEVPPEFWINRVALAQLKGGWSIPKEIDDRADVVVEGKGPVRRHERVKPAAVVSAPKPSRKWKVSVVSYSDSPVVDEGVEGLRAGLAEAGLSPGRDVAIDFRTAQGDIATLNAIDDEFNANDSDLVVAVTTPGLQSALRKIDRKPLIFGIVLDPIAAGAGKSDTDHRPNVTGVYLVFPFEEMAKTIHEVLPRARRIGTLFTPGETNSVVARERFERVLKSQGLELVSTPVNSASEATDAALSLCRSGIDVFCQIGDSLSNSCFPTIARACETTKTPLFAFASNQVKAGAILVVGSDYKDNGREAGLLVAEVLRGKETAQIPFRRVPTMRRLANLDTARRYGVTIPADWLRRADTVLPSRPAEAGQAAKP